MPAGKLKGQVIEATPLLDTETRSFYEFSTSAAKGKNVKVEVRYDEVESALYHVGANEDGRLTMTFPLLEPSAEIRVFDFPTEDELAEAQSAGQPEPKRKLLAKAVIGSEGGE